MMENGSKGDNDSTVDFTINGTPYSVSHAIAPGTSLNVFIRDHANLKGTKAMCHEGGCGACIVAVQTRGETMAVNSCLVPVLICHGWAIHTIEGIGNKKDGYHLMQTSLAEKNGSQCGYCSPGMVMNLYSLLQGRTLTMKEIENSFGSNICRCTGYRPILDTVKGFAVDAHPKLAKDIRDIEELDKYKLCTRTGLPCKDSCPLTSPRAANGPLKIAIQGANFYKVLEIDHVFSIFQEQPAASYILHGGNTAHGVYRTGKQDVYIDINDIDDLRQIHKTDQAVTLGGAVSLTAAMQAFQKYSKERGFEYLRHLAKHIDLIASVPVRNIGTIAGNLMIKHQHREFPSDLFLIFETAGAEIHVLESPSAKKSMSLLEFLEFDMNHKIVYSIVLPALSSEYEFRSYKIMPRAQNAHAHVNAGFLFKLDGGGKLLGKPNIIIGGIHPHFLHASRTENYLTGKSILDKNVVKTAIETLDSELNPDHVLPDYSPEFRKTLAEGLFYKFVLSVRPENVDPRLRSGGSLLERELSSGRQDFETDESVWPLNQPVPKIEAIYQTSGEAEYANDIPAFPDEVFCAFVLSEWATGTIESVDASDALKMEGVLAFYTAKDIPGKNVFISGERKYLMLEIDEPLFLEKQILCAGYPIGVVVAKTHNIAQEAAKKVRVTYANTEQKPVITIKDAIASNDQKRIQKTFSQAAARKGNNTKHVIKGKFECGGQYHYTMETQTCVCVPCEDGLDVYPSSQFVDLIQGTIADLLNMQNNRINIRVRRLGGGYGAKISRANMVACACALVSFKMNRPARMILTIEDNMRAVGKRYSNNQEYEIGVDDDGLIQYLNTKFWTNYGCSFNEDNGMVTVMHLPNCYDSSTWNSESYAVRTDIPSNTYCRAPGSAEAIAMAENMMEHISKTLNKDPVEVRLLNMHDDHKMVMKSMIEDLSKDADFEIRKTAAEAFNTDNRWKKKGIALVPMMYPFQVWGQFHALVSIYARDGTVSVTHGGIECGQGINTKVAQVAAFTLGIDLKYVTVKPTNNLTSPNNYVTGGSVTSDVCSYATMMACKELKKRLLPIKEELKVASWPEITMAAYQKDVDLCARHMFTTQDSVHPYPIYGVTIAEVEVDLLTGQHVVQRVDILEDTGFSLSPDIDLGQVEGAFVMGMGYWTSEDLIYDPKTGRLVNDRTWNYKPPGAKDIPVDFRVYFRRKAPNPLGVLRSKTAGEPPLCMSFAIPLAIRSALNSARKDAGNSEPWYQLDGPVTTERILKTSLTSKEQMML